MIKLQNGAAPLVHLDMGPDRPGVVLARVAGTKHTYVTWRVFPDGSCVWGNYFQTLESARGDFQKRAKEMLADYCSDL